MSAMVGLEVHIYVRTRSKLFCGCDADVLAAREPNTQVCHVCTAQPGAKPLAPNRAALEACIRLGRAVGGTLADRPRFLRKHYFYPDSPANYQRTSEPVVVGGAAGGVRLREVHVEEDPGTYDLATGLVDYNRAGAPLLELVTEPDMSSAAEARRFLDELRLALAYLGIGRGDAGIKADCNVSVGGGERVEVKNVNSTRNVERAVRYEIERQSKERAVRETRRFDEATGRTLPMRVKETEADYRYMPDPDVAALDIAKLSSTVPIEEGPFARRERLAAALGVPALDVEPILEERALADAYEQAAARAPPAAAFSFFVRDLRGDLGYAALTLEGSGLAADDLAALVASLAERKITPQAATRILREAIAARGDLGARLDAELAVGGAAQDAIAEAARAAVAENPKAVADWRAGKATAVNFLVGAAMKRLKGRGAADAVRAAVEAALRSA